MSERPTSTESQNPYVLSDTIAARIRSHRTRLGLTREDLAKECARHGDLGLTPSAIVNIEAGRPNPQTGIRRRCITIDEIAVFEKALGVGLLDSSPPCPTCQGEPPSGYSCRACGAEA